MEQTSKRLVKGNAYVIYWKDHSAHDSGGAWSSASDVTLEPPVAISAGWVIKQDKTIVALAQTVDKKVGIKGEVGNIWFILKNNIEKVVPIVLPKKEPTTKQPVTQESEGA